MQRGHCREKAIPGVQAKQGLVVLDRIRAEVRDLVRYLAEMVREEQNIVTTEQLEAMPMFDLAEDLE
jgi:hypothetical protein